MKTVFKLMMIIYIMSFMNCSKDSVEDERFNGIMQAKVNGELIVFESASGRGFFDLQNSCYKKFYEISGVNGFQAFSPSDYDKAPPEGQVITLGFKPSMGVGTYNLSGSYGYYENWTPPEYLNPIYYQQSHYCNDSSEIYEEEGSITILSTDNNRYKGTFYFKAVNCEDGKDIINITEGEFEINQEILHDRPCL